MTILVSPKFIRTFIRTRKKIPKRELIDLVNKKIADLDKRRNVNHPIFLKKYYWLTQTARAFILWVSYFHYLHVHFLCDSWHMEWNQVRRYYFTHGSEPHRYANGLFLNMEFYPTQQLWMIRGLIISIVCHKIRNIISNIQFRLCGCLPTRLLARARKGK